jgi:hypothetical protein
MWPCWPCNALYPQEFALTSPTSGGRRSSIIRSQTKATEFVLVFYLSNERKLAIQWPCQFRNKNGPGKGYSCFAPKTWYRHRTEHELQMKPNLEVCYFFGFSNRKKYACTYGVGGREKWKELTGTSSEVKCQCCNSHTNEVLRNLYYTSARPAQLISV